MPIRILSEKVASQIAAGEVVERPASVVKELVENAIDADARNISVEARSGGKNFIRVIDDGCGVPSDEVEMAFRRHSTSKLTTAEDLERITTLGFRGEALASIAAVSHMTFATRASGERMGTLLRLEGGRVITRQESGRPSGTAVTVEQLFYNVPARRKFLRTDRTERRHIDQWLTRYAMAYPEIRFKLSHNGRESFQSTGSGKLRDVLVSVYGLDIGASALEIMTDDPASSGSSEIEVSGFVGPPSLHRANRSYITLFVNGRWVQDASLTYAVAQAYHTFLPSGRYPVAVVMVELPTDEVDVNVHPAKAEVRFRDGDAVFRAVQKRVRRTLLERAPVPQVAAQASKSDHQTWTSAESSDWERRRRLAGLQAQGLDDGQLRLEGETAGDEEDSLPPLRVVGQVGVAYIVAEGPGGIYLLDQHAAHERVLFEQLLAEREQSGVPSQALLEPEPVDLAPEAADVLEEHLGILNSLGFQVENFGGSTMLVRALPAIVAETEPQQILEDVVAALLAGDDPLAFPIEEAVARRVCKRAAVKAGQKLDRTEMEELIRALEECNSPRTCPHGRPTMIHLSAAQLASEFGR
jgi:DNA mismatch repair protein MutL